MEHDDDEREGTMLDLITVLAIDLVAALLCAAVIVGGIGYVWGVF